MPIEGFSLAFSDHMLEPNPVWTRLDGTSGLVASFSIQRGRQDELAKTGTGTATVRLNDTTGLFDPTNTLSPYFGSIDGIQAGLAIWNPVDAEWVVVFRGFVDGYTYDVDPSGVVTRMEVELVDALDYLAGVELAPGTAGHVPPPESEGDVFYEDDEVDERVKAILTNAGWPVELRTIFTGNVNVKQTVYPPGTSALTALSDAADAEFPGVANIYVSKTGLVTFHGRHARFDPDGVSAGAGTAWDFTRWKAGTGGIVALDPTYAQIRRLSFSRPRKNIVNAAMALPDRTGDTPLTGAEIEAQIVSDAASITAYGVHSWSAENLLTHSHLTNPTNDLQETKLFADYYVANYAQPQTRVTGLGFRSMHPDDVRAAASWGLLTGVEISDIVRLDTIHPGDGAGFEVEEFYVEGISYDVEPLNGDYADVTLSLDVSPAAYYTDDPFGD